jgi:hypothetical protein
VILKLKTSAVCDFVTSFLPSFSSADEDWMKFGYLLDECLPDLVPDIDGWSRVALCFTGLA